MDAENGTAVFSIHNGESHSVTACFSTQLTMSLPSPHGMLPLAPLHWEQDLEGKWSTVIATDVAYGMLNDIAPKGTETFTVSVPNRGRYRAVMDYTMDLKVVRDCSVLYSGAYSKAHSAPVMIEQDRRPPDHKPELIPRH
jgi:hypothetical protein